ncbi:MAG: hypothetical protein ACKVS9_08885 [Phycisphaerae bacterium]
MLSLRVLVSRAALAGWAVGSAAPTLLHGGQCELVQLSSYGLAGTDCAVRGVGTWDPDGDGPLPQNLIAIGWFSQAGAALCHSIAMFDGTAWHPLGSGVGSPGSAHINAATEFGGELVVGGSFDVIGGVAARGVARWNGSTWLPMGSQLRWAGSFAQRERQLFVAGNLDGTSTGSTVVRWDGSQWSAIAPAITTTGILTADDADNLLVAGSLSLDGSPFQRRVARWDGSTWTLLGGSFDAEIYSVIARGGEIFVGGQFQNIDGQPARYLARWDGAIWHAVTESIDGLVLALETHGNDVLLGGLFRNVGGVPANRIARWDGTTFHPLAIGLDFGTHRYCSTMTEFRGALVAAGSFGQAGDKPVAHIAQWSGTDWSQIGGEIGLAGLPTQTEDIYVDVVGEYRGDVVIGGVLHFAAGSRNIARRSADGWAGLGSGVQFDVLALAETPQGLLAGGYSSPNIPGPLAHPLALWNGQSWEPIGLGSFQSRVVIF